MIILFFVCQAPNFINAIILIVASDPTIKVKNLKKYYRVFEKEPGFVGSIKSFFNRKYHDVLAVDNISFEINEGELVGFIGPNGAGKTTTLKCLSGLLYPTKGTISVLGFKPYLRVEAFQKQMSLVMGQKNQLWWDLPPMETFILNKEIYEIDDKKFKETVEVLSKILEIQTLIKIPVKKLSLGERMKAELVASLLHNPKVLFLDEPTIGLDVVMQKKIRDFIKEHNKNFKATIILTSHYMEDVKQLCKRVIIIDKGKILFDGQLSEIIKKHAKYKTFSLILQNPVDQSLFKTFGIVKSYDFPKLTLLVPREKSNFTVGVLLEKFPIEDLLIEEEDIEDIVREIFIKKHV